MKKHQDQQPQKIQSQDDLLLSCEQELHKAETRILLLQQLTLAISEATDFNAALNTSLKTICDLTGWCYAEAWVPSPDRKTLQCSPAWFRCSRELIEFRQLTMGMTFAPGVGLPGRVWKHKKPEWIKDVSATHESLFLRLSLAQHCDLKACFGVPVTKNHDVMAVLLFFMHEEKGEDCGMVETVSSLAVQLGALIHRKRIEDDLAESQSKLRNLSLSLQRSMETERKALARRIHDEFGQSLSALKMELSWLKKQLHEDQKHLFHEIDKTNGLIQTILRSVQIMSAELRPHMLDDMGLIAAIRWKAKTFEEKRGIHCLITAAPDDIALDPDRAIALFRIFQEALFNIANHADATKVLVNVKKENGLLLIEIIDDGRGITLAEIADPKSIGLIGMQERAHCFGGLCNITGIPGKGTTVNVSIPLANGIYPQSSQIKT